MGYEWMLRALGASGCDVSGAMNRMMQDAGFYKDCLESFSRDPLFDELGKAIAAGDAAEAFEHAHAIKGVAANLGLTPVLQPVTKLVERLRAGRMDGADELYTVVSEQMEVLRACLKEA